VHYLVPAAIAFLLGLTADYILSILWVFDTGAYQSRWYEFTIFYVIGIICLGLNEGITLFFNEKVRFHSLVSKIVSTAVVYCWNFFVRKFILFS